MFIQDWADVLTSALQQVWENFIVALPTVIVAVIIFIIGWIIAVTLGKVVHEVVKAIKIDVALAKLGANAPLQRAGLRLDAGALIGGLVKWFIVVAFLMASTNILHLDAVSGFLNDVLLYIPNVIVAAVILLIAAMLSTFLQRVVVSSVAAAGLTSANFLGTVTRWSVMIFGFLVALSQLGIAASFINTVFIGIVAMLAIAGGLAFGLGGKEHASVFLSKLREEIAERR